MPTFRKHLVTKCSLLISCKDVYLANLIYMTRVVPGNASDNVHYTLLAKSVVHGAMASYTGFTIGHINVRHHFRL